MFPNIRDHNNIAESGNGLEYFIFKQMKAKKFDFIQVTFLKRNLQEKLRQQQLSFLKHPTQKERDQL